MFILFGGRLFCNCCLTTSSSVQPNTLDAFRGAEWSSILLLIEKVTLYFVLLGNDFFSAPICFFSTFAKCEEMIDTLLKKPREHESADTMLHLSLHYLLSYQHLNLHFLQRLHNNFFLTLFKEKFIRSKFLSNTFEGLFDLEGFFTEI